MKEKSTTKSTEAIRKNFLLLLNEKRLNKITVSELTKMAGVSRGTFYLHYKDIHDLYTKIENELYENLDVVFNKHYPYETTDDLVVFIDAILEYLYENKELFNMLMRPETCDQTLFKIRKFFGKIILDKNPEKYSDLKNDTVEILFLISGFTGVIEEALIHNLSIEKDELLKIFNDLILRLNKKD